MSESEQKTSVRSHLREYSYGLVLMGILGLFAIAAVGAVLVGLGFLIVAMPMTTTAVVGVFVIAFITALRKEYRK